MPADHRFAHLVTMRQGSAASNRCAELHRNTKLIRSAPCIQLLNSKWVDVTVSMLLQVLQTVLHCKVMIGITSLKFSRRLSDCWLVNIRLCQQKWEMVTKPVLARVCKQARSTTSPGLLAFSIRTLTVSPSRCCGTLPTECYGHCDQTALIPAEGVTAYVAGAAAGVCQNIRHAVFKAILCTGGDQ